MHQKDCHPGVSDTKTGLGQYHNRASNTYNDIPEERSSLFGYSEIQQEALCTSSDVSLITSLILVATWAHSAIVIPVATLGQPLSKRCGIQNSIMTAESFAVGCCHNMPAVAVTVLLMLLKFKP